MGIANSGDAVWNRRASESVGARSGTASEDLVQARRRLLAALAIADSAQILLSIVIGLQWPATAPFLNSTQFSFFPSNQFPSLVLHLEHGSGIKTKGLAHFLWNGDFPVFQNNGGHQGKLRFSRGKSKNFRRPSA